MLHWLRPQENCIHKQQDPYAGICFVLESGGGDGQGRNWITLLWLSMSGKDKNKQDFKSIYYIQTHKMHPKFFLGTNHKVNLWERLEISPKWAVRGLWKRPQDPNLYISCLIQGIPKTIAGTRENTSWWCPRCCSGKRGDKDVIGNNHIHFPSHPLLRMKSLRGCILNLPLLMLISTILILPSAPNVHSSTSSQVSKVTHKAKYSWGWWVNEILLSISLSSSSLPL